MSRIDPPFIVVVFDVRITSDTLTAVGSGTITSAYTESGAEPGLAEPVDPASPWRPGIVGAQSNALTVNAVRGGFPGRRGAGLLYRLATDTDLIDYRGWSPPNLVTGWSSPPNSWNDGNSWTRLTICTDPTTGILVAIGQDATTTDAMTWSYDPRTNLWTDRYDWSANEGLVASTFPTLAPDPDVEGRILLFAGHIGYYSDDLGATWSLRTKDPVDAGNVSLDVAVAPGVDWLAAGRSSDGNLYASSDRGASWETTEDITADVSANSARVVFASGAFLVVYRRSSDNQPCVRRLAHARASFADAGEVVVDATSSRDVTAVLPTVDEDGTVYVFARDFALPDLVRVYGSKDGGLTWARYRWGAFAVDSGPNGLIPEAVTTSNGSSFLLCRVAGGTALNTHLVRLGGWSTSESGTSQPTYAGANAERIGYGYYDGASTGAYGGLFFPSTVPASHGWTNGSAGGAAGLAGSAPGLDIVTGAGAARTYFREAPASKETNAGEVFLASVTQSGPNFVPFVEVELTNGAYSYRTAIAIGTAGVVAFDADAVTTLGSLLAIATTAGVHVRWHVSQGKATVLARLPTETNWQVVCSNATVTDGTPVAAVDRVTWGHRAVGSGTDESRWFFVGSSAGGAMLHGLTGSGYANPATAKAPLEYGGPMPSAATGGYPIPDATAPGEDLGRLSAAGGPVAVADPVGLPVEYRHGIHHIHPPESPTPADYWEATGASDAVLTYDLAGLPTWFGGALAVVVLHATARTVVVTTGTNPDGVTGWVTAGTMDLSLGSVTYDRVGDTISPATGTAVIARKIEEGELVGGWLPIAGAGATIVYRRIAANSGGYWTDAAGVQQVRIRLEGVDGTEDASGTAALYHHSGVCILYAAADTPRRFIRLTVAGLGTDDGAKASAGILTPGRVVGVGAAPGWAWTRRIDETATLSRAGDGTVSKREDGPPRETWTYGWQEGLAWGEARTAADPGDYVAIAGGAPIGTAEDAAGLQALLEHASRSGEIPIVIVPNPPTSTAVTLTDPTRFLYGIPVAEAAVLSGFAGEEGVNEFVRYDGVTVEGIGGRTPRGRS